LWVSYYPFGSTQEGLNYASTTLTDNDLENKYLFGGREKDDKTGFYEYHFRQYDSWLGRWHVVDPMAEMYGTQSPYHFGGNNPINNAEVNGAVWQEAVADGIERDIDEWGNVASGGTGTRTTYRGPTTFFGSGGYYGVYGSNGYMGSSINGMFFGVVGPSFEDLYTYIEGTEGSGWVKNTDIIHLYDSQYGWNYAGLKEAEEYFSELAKKNWERNGEETENGANGPITSDDLKKMFKYDYKEFFMAELNDRAQLDNGKDGFGLISWISVQTLQPDYALESKYPELINTVADVNAIHWTYSTSPKYNENELQKYGKVQWGLELVGEVYPYFSYTKFRIEAPNGYYYHIRIQWKVGPRGPEQLLGFKY
jgi:RHS repeat-associated protein